MLASTVLSVVDEESEEYQSELETTVNEGDRNSTTSDTDHSLAHKETRAVNRSKLLVYLALLMAATAVGTTTYFLTTQEQNREFEAEFAGYAKEIVYSSEENAANIFGQVRSLSTTMTSYELSMRDVTWPNFSLPHFHIRAEEAQRLSGAELIAFAPLVTRGNKTSWEEYAVKNQGWIKDDLKARGWTFVKPGNISETIYSFDETKGVASNDDSLFVPLWQIGPVPTNAAIVMMDIYTHPTFSRMISDVINVRHVLLSEVVDLDFMIQYSNMMKGFVESEHPRSFLLQPVFDSFNAEGNLVGFLIAVLPWEKYFQNVLPEGVNGFLVAVADTCGSKFSYYINGPDVIYHGRNNMHDARYDYVKQTSMFAGFEDDVKGTATYCKYTLDVYPTSEFHAKYESGKPAMYAGVVVLVFFCTTMVFVVYDCTVQRRQEKVMHTAKHTKKIISSLFPKDVQQRIMEEAEEEAEKEVASKKKKGFVFAPKEKLKNFLDDGKEECLENPEMRSFKSKPIADLFPEVTLMFADLVGFTAWSSTREPSQVFLLLETIFYEFDVIARRRRVFKVETVGDCYVAAAGLPDQRSDHAVVMARFSRDCLYRMRNLTKRLEVELGPDTAELGMRFGVHSGPVTAGVLRGERARFQLFGDTVNTAARIESTGQRNKIHVSQETAEQLTARGKGHWLVAREDAVVAKGKGTMRTHWLEMKGSEKSARSSDCESCSDMSFSQSDMGKTDQDQFADELDAMKTLSDKEQRLVNWNTDILAKVLREIVAQRDSCGTEADCLEEILSLEESVLRQDGTVLDEVAECIELPQFNAQLDADVAVAQDDLSRYDLGRVVMEQLREYVRTVAALYRDNPFHNFEHASHVTQSVVKLLSRIVAPDLQVSDEGNVAKDLHDHTYGITSDPLTRFSLILAALIHDADHTGVPNAQLIKEDSRLAAVYKNKSIAEQNSVDICWDLLMEDCFLELRRVIYSTKAEFSRFRQLVVNSVMATDIMDKELGALRKGRWNKAFTETVVENEITSINRKATIVIEHVIQASDVAHTMQHWQIYRKWNQRLFEELHRAYIEGRAEKNPADFWFQGEIGFLDHYIIPLAMKLKSCGVFGVSSDEYLNYARQNRQEWESKGKDVVAEMVDKLNHPKEPKPSSAAGTSLKASSPPNNKPEPKLGSPQTCGDAAQLKDMPDLPGNAVNQKDSSDRKSESASSSQEIVAENPGGKLLALGTAGADCRSIGGPEPEQNQVETESTATASSSVSDTEKILLDTAAVTTQSGENQESRGRDESVTPSNVNEAQNRVSEEDPGVAVSLYDEEPKQCSFTIYQVGTLVQGKHDQITHSAESNATQFPVIAEQKQDQNTSGCDEALHLPYFV